MGSIAKRCLDLLVAGSLLLLSAPLLAVVSLAIAATLGRPVFFRQRRPGLGGKPFYLYKFRTMKEQRNAAGELLPDGERLTTLGRWLRSSSLDELPTLWNVLKGDMSLVGPRPLLMQYLERYSPEQARRHEVVPGITGWAQIHGRNRLSWEEKFALDVWYVDHQSFFLDLKILAKTLGTVLRREGISAQGQATAEEFRGSSE